MAHYKVIKLTSLSPLHIGNGRETYDFSAGFLHSDTLISALASLKASRGETHNLYDFMNSFTLSSAFPFYNQQFYLPRIKGDLKVTVQGQEEKDYRKKLKKIEYIDSRLWNSLIEGKTLALESQHLQHAFLIHSEAVKLFQQSQPFESQVNERVKIVQGEDAMPFYFDWTYFHHQAGLYVIVDCADDLFDEIYNLFEELGQNGIGTDKSVGGGQFVPQKAPIELPEVKNPNAELLLSLFIPTREDLKSITLNQSHYQIIKRGGYISGSNQNILRHLRKKSVYMFEEGSVLLTHQALKGCVVDLAPKWNGTMHPVYRSGRLFSLPINYE